MFNKKLDTRGCTSKIFVDLFEGMIGPGEHVHVHVCFLAGRRLTGVTSCSRQYTQTTDGNHTQESVGEQDDEGDEREYDTKQRILAASMPFVANHGWTRNALAAGAEAEGLPGIAHGLFPRGGVELAFYFYGNCNRSLADRLAAEVKAIEGQPETEGPKVRPFIRNAVEMRLRMIIPYIDRWPQAMGMMTLPRNAPKALKHLTTLTDEIWYHAGDRSTDFNWYTKRGLLAAIYKGTEIYMMQDKSDMYTDTWQFLDRRIEDASSLAKLVKNGEECRAVTSEAVQGMAIMAMNILGMNSRSK